MPELPEVETTLPNQAALAGQSAVGGAFGGAGGIELSSAGEIFGYRFCNGYLVDSFRYVGQSEDFYGRRCAD